LARFRFILGMTDGEGLFTTMSRELSGGSTSAMPLARSAAAARELRRASTAEVM
jgi:hypothetical protein